jgi:hypothetical protein
MADVMWYRQLMVICVWAPGCEFRKKGAVSAERLQELLKPYMIPGMRWEDFLVRNPMEEHIRVVTSKGEGGNPQPKYHLGVGKTNSAQRSVPNLLYPLLSERITPLENIHFVTDGAKRHFKQYDV